MISIDKLLNKLFIDYTYILLFLESNNLIQFNT